MSQNADLEARRKDFKMVHLDENLKNELRKSHFLMGNFNPNYNTAFKSEFQKKEYTYNQTENRKIANNNKSYSHKMGSDRVTYVSETHNKYISPEMNRTITNQK